MAADGRCSILLCCLLFDHSTLAEPYLATYDRAPSKRQVPPLHKVSILSPLHLFGSTYGTIRYHTYGVIAWSVWYRTIHNMVVLDFLSQVLLVCASAFQPIKARREESNLKFALPMMTMIADDRRRRRRGERQNVIICQIPVVNNGVDGELRVCES